MRIRYLKMSNFRSVANGEIFFPEHTVLIGGNSMGKSTICEALDLLLGPLRLARASPIDEHDFFKRRYIDENKNPIPIKLEVVLTDLTDDVLTRFRSHIEFWNISDDTLLDETASPEDTEDENVVHALRINFEGTYDIEEDDFSAETFFASPPPEDEDHRIKVSRAAKRQFGFIYLRALRTGSRALSLEKGSLLDIILSLKDDDRYAMWEQTLKSMEDLKPAIDEMPQLNSILNDVAMRVRQFVGLSDNDRTLRLYPSSLTRESLRRSITLFGSSERSNTPVPYWRLGSGVINSMVFSLLTIIAELKSNVIFAMEEPELAIPPHTQRRIVQFLQKKMDQTILTTHSPFVLEQYKPQHVVILERTSAGEVSGRNIEITGIKAKTYKGNLRKILAEAMLGNGVLCVEGVSDAEVIYSASTLLEAHSEEGSYTPLDLSGITVVPCDGHGELLKYGQFFANLGLKIYAFFDNQNNAEKSKDINDLFFSAWELEQFTIEHLLSEEISIGAIRKFLDEVSEWNDYPASGDQASKYEYDPDADDEKIRNVCKEVLLKRKGAGYAQRLIEHCSVDDLPMIVVDALNRISDDFPHHIPPYVKEENGSEEESGNPYPAEGDGK